MDYGLAVEKLREKIEALQQGNNQLREKTEALQRKNMQSEEKIEALQQGNTQLRDEVAVLSNENYTLKCDHLLIIAELEQNLAAIQQELTSIRNSNFYKVWIKLQKLPKPIRSLVHGIFKVVKSVYKGIKKVFK